MTAVASRPPVSPAPTRSPGRIALPLVISVLCTITVVVIHRVFIRTITGQAVDTGALNGADVGHPHVVQLLSKALNGTTLVSLVLACLAAAAIGVVRRRVDLAIGAAVLVLGANLTTQLLKTRLDRPNLDGFPAPNSFPSGHTTAAASVAFALMLALPVAVRGMIALIGTAYVAVIAVATVWAEWHRPSDTVAGLLIALAWGGVVSAALRAHRMHASPTSARPSRLTMMLLAAAFAVAALAGLLGLGTALLSERVSSDLVSTRFAFVSGAACIAAAVAGAFLIWTRLAGTDRYSRTQHSPSQLSPSHQDD